MDWTTFMQDYGGYVLLIVLVLAIFVVRLIGKRKEKKAIVEKPVERQITNFEDLPFSQGVTLLDNLKRNRDKARKEIATILSEGKVLAREKKDVESYYAEQNAILNIKIEQLGVRNSTWKKQLEMLERMIAEQEEMEERISGKKR